MHAPVFTLTCQGLVLHWCGCRHMQLLNLYALPALPVICRDLLLAAGGHALLPCLATCINLDVPLLHILL